MKHFNSENIEDIETKKLIITFCTWLSLLYGRKFNFAQVFLLLLKNKEYRETLKAAINTDSDQELFRTYLEIDPTLFKSKYIQKYINSHKAFITKNFK